MSVVLCFQYKKLFPLGYEYVESRHKYESSPNKEQNIASEVKDMIRYEFSLLVPSEKVNGLLNDCFCFPRGENGRTISLNKRFDIFQARKIIDSLCTRVYARWKIENSTQIMLSKATHLQNNDASSTYSTTLGYDYMWVESPIVSEYKLIQAETQRKAEESNRRLKEADERMLKQLRLGDGCYFQIHVTEEQKDYAKKLVQSSMAHDFSPDYFKRYPDGKQIAQRKRFVGTLGEVLFADVYNLPRPTISYDSFNVAEYGHNFILRLDGVVYSLNVITVSRENSVLYDNYVFRIASYQLNKDFSRMDFYYPIMLHEQDGVTIATFVGLIKKDSVVSGEIGELCVTGTRRGVLTYSYDTHEILCKELARPLLTNRIRNVLGFKILRLSSGGKENYYINLENKTCYSL